MGIDLKYHITSLIAIFLALGLGILIGNTIVPGTVILERQNAMIASLEKDFEKIKTETQLVRKSLETNLRFEKEILPYIISNKITGINVSIIGMKENNYEFVSENLLNILKISGANISSLIFFTKQISLNEDIKKIVTTNLDLTEQDENVILDGFFKILSEEIAGIKNTEILEYLKKNKFIKLKKISDTSPDSIVFFGGYDVNEIRLILAEEKIIENLKKLQKNVIGVETQDVGNSQIPDFKKLEISTVDNIETIPGQIALILLLSGKKGNFGVKSTAQSLLPKYE